MHSEPAGARGEVAALLQLARSEGRLPGVSAAIITRAGKVSERAGNARRRSAVRDSTKFRIGSVSKALTSAGLGVLIDDGALDLDAPIQQYVPFPDPAHGTITIRHLATHQSGIPHYRGFDFVNRRSYPSLTDAVDKFRDRPMLFAPGEQFAYSSFAWNLLGAAMEAAAGMTYIEFMTERVFVPAGLGDLTPDRPGDTAIATPYVRLLGLAVPAPRVDNSDAWPSAGWAATARGLAGFGAAMLQGTVVPAPILDLLWEETSVAGSPTGYGMGWQWREFAGHRAVGHGGSHVGATSGLWIVPESEVIVAMATNTNAPSGIVDHLIASLIEVALD